MAPAARRYERHDSVAPSLRFPPLAGEGDGQWCLLASEADIHRHHAALVPLLVGLRPLRADGHCCHRDDLPEYPPQAAGRYQRGEDQVLRRHQSRTTLTADPYQESARQAAARYPRPDGDKGPAQHAAQHRPHADTRQPDIEHPQNRERSDEAALRRDRLW